MTHGLNIKHALFRGVFRFMRALFVAGFLPGKGRHVRFLCDHEWAHGYRSPSILVGETFAFRART